MLEGRTVHFFLKCLVSVRLNSKNPGVPIDRHFVPKVGGSARVASSYCREVHPGSRLVCVCGIWQSLILVRRVEGSWERVQQASKLIGLQLPDWREDAN